MVTVSTGALLVFLGSAAMIGYFLRKRKQRKFAPEPQEGHEMQPISGITVAARAEEANEDLYDVYGSAEDIAWPDEDSDEVNGRETNGVR